jgi:hypothetical protein
VASDNFGCLYIADCFNNRIRKVDTNGIITTVAGNGTTAYSGDGGAATNAGIYNPQGVGLNAAGELYVADTLHYRIRRVDSSGNIRTVAGTNSGPIFYSGDGGPATNAKMYNPYDVAFDVVGNMYIADTRNQRVRRVDTNGIITTVAGKGGGGAYGGDGGAATNAWLNWPSSVALDAAGNLYIADYGNHRVRKVFPPGGPTLVLAYLSAKDAGNYAVIVTNAYGSVTSDVAVLTVTIPRTPPQIITGDGSFGFLSNQFGFNLSGAAGQTIVVEGSTDLVGWAPLYTNTVAGSPFYFFDPGWTNYPQRYYRAKLP